MDTIKLCLALREAGYQPEAKADPEAWNAKWEIQDGDTLETINSKNEGYRWEQHPSEGWYPNPGRLALARSIKEMIGDERFEAKYGTVEKAKSLGHEALMNAWLKEKNDISN